MLDWANIDTQLDIASERYKSECDKRPKLVEYMHTARWH